MCNDMRRFERMAEEKRRSKKENEVDFVVKGIEEVPVNSTTEVKAHSRT